MGNEKVSDEEKDKRAKMLKELGERHGFSRAQVRELADVSATTIMKWYKGELPVSDKYARLIADKFGFCVYEFWEVNDAYAGADISITKRRRKGQPKFKYGD